MWPFRPSSELDSLRFLDASPFGSGSSMTRDFLCSKVDPATSICMVEVLATSSSSSSVSADIEASESDSWSQCVACIECLAAMDVACPGRELPGDSDAEVPVLLVLGVLLSVSILNLNLNLRKGRAQMFLLEYQYLNSHTNPQIEQQETPTLG